MHCGNVCPPLNDRDRTCDATQFLTFGVCSIVVVLQQVTLADKRSMASMGFSSSSKSLSCYALDFLRWSSVRSLRVQAGRTQVHITENFSE